MVLADITDFRGTFLSNFYTRTNLIAGWQSVEHAYQAGKDPLNEAYTASIFTCGSAANSKKLGRKAKLQPDWETYKVKLMWALLNIKFWANKDLYQKLVETGPARLIEQNYWHDNFWGACTCASCQEKPQLNTLGKMLMKIRDFLAMGETPPVEY